MSYCLTTTTQNFKIRPLRNTLFSVQIDGKEIQILSQRGPKSKHQKIVFSSPLINCKNLGTNRWKRSSSDDRMAICRANSLGKSTQTAATPLPLHSSFCISHRFLKIHTLSFNSGSCRGIKSTHRQQPWILMKDARWVTTTKNTTFSQWHPSKYDQKKDHQNNNKSLAFI